MDRNAERGLLVETQDGRSLNAAHLDHWQESRGCWRARVSRPGLALELTAGEKPGSIQVRSVTLLPLQGGLVGEWGASSSVCFHPLRPSWGPGLEDHMEIRCGQPGCNSDMAACRTCGRKASLGMVVRCGRNTCGMHSADYARLGSKAQQDAVLVCDGCGADLLPQGRGTKAADGTVGRWQVIP